MQGALFYTMCIGFASGIFFRSFFNPTDAGIGLVFVMSLACACLWRRGAHSFGTPLFLASLFLMVFGLGLLRMDIAEDTVSPLVSYVGEEVEVVGKVVREPEARAQTVHLHITPQFGDAHLKERILVTVPRFTYEGKVAYGDSVRVVGELAYPEPFETDGGRTFDYPGYLKAQRVGYVIRDATLAVLTPGAPSPLRALYKTKHDFIDSLESILPHPHAGLGEGVLLGVKRALGETLDEVFRKTGIIHIVVLSGYNVLIVVEALIYVLAYFFRPRMRMLIGILGIITFAFLVGMSATVVRACIMASLLLIARGTGRVYGALRGLAIAGVAMLLLNPFLLAHDPGFQLSFLATLGLLLLSPFFERHLTFIPRAVGMRSIVTATVATQVAVSPLLLYHTGMFSVVSIIVNVLVLPVVPIVMFGTFLTGLVGMFSHTLGSGIGYLTYLLLDYIITVASWFAGLPFSAQTISTFPFWMVGVGYALIGVWYMVYGKEDSGRGVEEKKENTDDVYDTPPMIQGILPFR